MAKTPVKLEIDGYKEREERGCVTDYEIFTAVTKRPALVFIKLDEALGNKKLLHLGNGVIGGMCPIEKGKKIFSRILIHKLLLYGILMCFLLFYNFFKEKSRQVLEKTGKML